MTISVIPGIARMFLFPQILSGYADLVAETVPGGRDGMSTSINRPELKQII